MAQYLKITDGTTTIDLLGNDPAVYFNLPVNTWGPAVATRSRNKLAGTPFDDVIERIPLYADSTTSSAALLENIEQLTALIDQATRWYDGDAVDPVVIQYSPNSSVDYVEAVIMGSPPNEPAIVLPPSFSDDLYQNLVDGIVLQFVRRGQWLDDEEPISKAAAEDAQIIVPTTNFTDDVDIPSPYKVEMLISNTPTQANGFLLLAKSSDRLAFLEAESMTGTPPLGGSFNVAGDSDASGGSIRRLEPTVSGIYRLIDTSLSMSSNARKFAAYLSCRNNSSSIFYTVITVGNLISKSEGTTRPVIIDSDNDSEQVIFLGTFSTISELKNVQVWFTPSETGADTLDVDYVAVIAIDGDGSHVVRLSDIGEFSATPTTVVIDHALLKSRSPIVTQEAGTLKGSLPYSGNVYFQGLGNSMRALLLVNSFEGWRMRETGTGTLCTFTLTATRRRGYLVAK